MQIDDLPVPFRSGGFASPLGKFGSGAAIATLTRRHPVMDVRRFFYVVVASASSVASKANIIEA